MMNLTLSLPELLKEFVEAEAAAGGFANPSEYVKEVLCQEFRMKARKRLEDELLVAQDAIDRGEVEEMTEKDWEEIRAEVEEHYRAKEAG